VRELGSPGARNTQRASIPAVSHRTREGFEHATILEGLRSELGREAPVIVEACPRGLISRDPRQLPQIVRELCARGSKERANRSDCHARLRAAGPRGSGARADRGLYWPANGA
jgi:hypothetical protein